MRIRFTICVVLLTLLMTATYSQAELIAHPTEFKLVYNTSLQRLVVLNTKDDQTSEVTAEVTYAVADQSVARVDEFGVVRPIGDGTTAITISHPDGQTEVSVQVSESDQSAPVSFELDVHATVSSVAKTVSSYRYSDLIQTSISMRLRVKVVGVASFRQHHTRACC